MINEKYCLFVYPNEFSHINMCGETFIGTYDSMEEAKKKAKCYIHSRNFVSIVKNVFCTFNNVELVVSDKYGEEVEEINVAKWVHFMKICGEMD